MCFLGEPYVLHLLTKHAMTQSSAAPQDLNLLKGHAEVKIGGDPAIRDPHFENLTSILRFETLTSRTSLREPHPKAAILRFETLTSRTSAS